MVMVVSVTVVEEEVLVLIIPIIHQLVVNLNLSLVTRGRRVTESRDPFRAVAGVSHLMVL